MIFGIDIDRTLETNYFFCIKPEETGMGVMGIEQVMGMSVTYNSRHNDEPKPLVLTILCLNAHSVE